MSPDNEMGVSKAAQAFHWSIDADYGSVSVGWLVNHQGLSPDSPPPENIYKRSPK